VGDDRVDVDERQRREPGLVSNIVEQRHQARHDLLV
jgi:hypothetical protein